MNVNWQLAWHDCAVSRIHRAVARWTAGSLIHGGIRRLYLNLRGWAGGSRILAACGRALGDHALRGSTLGLGVVRLGDWWWRWSGPCRELLATAVGGSLIAGWIRDVGHRGRGLIGGSAAGALARIAVSHPYQVVALAVFVLLWPFLPNEYIAVAVIGLWALRLLAGPGGHDRSPALVSSPVAVPWFMLGAALTISYVFSVTPRESLPYFSAWIAAFLAAYLALDTFRSPRQGRLLFGAIALSATAVSVLGIWQALIRVKTDPSWVDSRVHPELITRVFSVFDSPIILGQFLALTIPLTLYILIRGDARHRLLAATGVAIQTVALVLTYTRGSWMAAIAAVALLLLWWRRELLVVFLCLVIIAPAFLPPVLVSRFMSAFDLQYGTNQYRIAIWQAVPRIFRDHPWTGIGLGPEAFRTVYPNYMTTATYSLHSHNLFIQLALEAGIGGLLFTVWFLAALGHRVVGFLKRTTMARHGMTVALAIGLGSLTIQGLVDHIWFRPKFLILFWFLTGLLMASLGWEAEDGGERA